MGPRFESVKVHQTVSVINAEGPPVPIPNTEVKLWGAENTCLETSREDRSMLTQGWAEVIRRRAIVLQKVRGESACTGVGDFNAEGPPVPIPNTEVKLHRADNTWWATVREDR